MLNSRDNGLSAALTTYNRRPQSVRALIDDGSKDGAPRQ